MISVSSFKDFVRFVEQLLCDSKDERIKSAVRQKACEVLKECQEIEQAQESGASEELLQLPHTQESTEETIVQSESEISFEQSASQGTGSETVEEPTVERRVHKRRKRVQRKISKTTQHNTTQIQTQMFGNNQRKYLLEELSKRDSKEEQTQVYMEYLKGCKFNAEFSPNGIITFDQHEANTLGQWAADDNRNSYEVPMVAQKLKHAMEQRYQLASQQALEIGKLLLDAEFVSKQSGSSSVSTTPSRRGRPIQKSIYQIIAETNDCASEASLRDMSYVAMTVMKFPLLRYINEPVSHLSSRLVREAVVLMSDVMQESSSIPQNIAKAYNTISPYVLDVNKLNLDSLLQPIPLNCIIPNDGDGLVEMKSPDGIQEATYHRLFGVDAPELYAINFIKTDTELYKRRNGHLSHLALYYYLNSFVTPRGNAFLCREKPNISADVNILEDKYGRPISSYWLVWLDAPSDHELTIIHEIIEALNDQDNSIKRRVMSPFDPRNASEELPFYVNLNAVLVLAGFCRYSPDASLLKLQEIAKRKHLGCIWSDVKKNIVLGARQTDFSAVDESTKVIMAQFDRTTADNSGYPLKYTKDQRTIRMQPWHEREVKNQLKQGGRHEFQEHKKMVEKIPYGFIIDMDTNIDFFVNHHTSAELTTPQSKQVNSFYKFENH